jgi:ATP-dependent RNA helicase DeaD
VPSARPPRREDAARATPDAHATAAGTHPRDGVRPPRSHHEEAHRTRPPRREGAPHVAEPGFETFRIEVGEEHGVKPANIVGAIANEAGLDSKHIGRVAIHHDHSTVDLPEGMPPEIFKHLKRVWVSGQQLRITRASGADEAAPRQRGRPPRPPSFGDGSASPKRHARKPRPGK